jgi:hypothetical protein
MNRVKTDHPNYVRDQSSQAIVLTDKSAVEAYRQKKKLHNQVETLEARVAALEKIVLENRT